MNPALLLVLVMLGAGYACARFDLIPREASDGLHRFVLYICLPAMIWRLVPTLQREPDLWLIVLTPWLLLGVSAGLTYGLCRALGWSRGVTGALLLCVPLGNTSFLGFPMVAALLGEPALRYAVLYDQLGSFLALSTYGLFIVSYFSGGAPPSAAQVLRRIVSFPPFIALLLAFTPLVRFAVLQPVWQRLSETLVPVAMFAVGLRIELRPPRPYAGVAAGLALKLLVVPALAWLFLRAVDAQPLLLRVAVLEASMPAMITAGAFAMLAGLAPELAAALVGYGVLISLVTLPLIAALLGS
ncbi:MAG: AEC family transporter [Polyangiales bacterium]